MSGDKGRYVLVEAMRRGGIVKALHKRIAPDGAAGFTRTETDCTTMRMREHGYSAIGPDKVEKSITKWFDLVPGSSKSDLALFVCRAIR